MHEVLLCLTKTPLTANETIFLVGHWHRPAAIAAEMPAAEQDLG